MSNHTWTGDDPVDEAAAAPRAAQPVTETIGGTTVLPRRGNDEGSVVQQPQGPRFDKFKELGRGGLGVVVSAVDRDIGRRVAIKQLRADRTSRGALLRFAEEVRTVGALDHPYIVPIHDVGIDALGAPYFVMKHVEGRTLTEIITDLKQGDEAAHAHWPFTRRLEVFRKVLEAVSFAHDAGIIHRDLKPDNIMIGAHGEVHVLDWGIARRSNLPDLPPGDDASFEGRVTETRDGAIMGTPAYMAPEQARGDAVDVRSDLYSLAVVLHEFLGLTHYLEGIDDLDQLLEGVQKTPAPNLMMKSVDGQPTVPAHVHWMVMKALSKSPADRFPSARDWLERLEGFADGDIPVQCPFTLQRSLVSRLAGSMDDHPILWTMAFLFVSGTALTAVVTGFLFSFVFGALVV